MTVKCMDRVVRIYKQALFRNQGLLSSIPQFTLERSWPTMQINSRVNFRKTPEIPTLCGEARLIQSHRIRGDKCGTSATVVDQNGLESREWIACARGKHGLWAPLAPHILVAPGLIELQAFDYHAFQSNTYMDCVNPRIDCVQLKIKHV